jgi:periplasmic protein TonB
MFGTLESTWDHSFHRRLTALASFIVQTFGIALLLLLPILTIPGPPILTRIIRESVLAPPPGPVPAMRVERPSTSSNFHEGHLQEPQTIPDTITNLNEPQIASAPNLDNIGVIGATGTSGRGIAHSLGSSFDVVTPPRVPTPARPLKISHWAEGNLISRVQPIYPPLARQARIQGSVELRAIISKAGTIENLTVVSGHPMLIRSAIDAVRKWRYRPYFLNNEPIEVETEITVNFMLSGG